LEGENPDEPTRALPLSVRSILQLTSDEKLAIRAETTLLFPQIFSPSRSNAKKAVYVDVSMYLMTYHGILAHQTRDFFSAGSVGQNGPTGNFIRDATGRIQPQMKDAALYLEDDLFLEYWGVVPEPADRISEWLIRADQIAQGWIPSEEFFLEEKRIS
jgi:hypothetical protein